MAKDKVFGFKKDNLSRQKVLPSKEPRMSLYDHLKGYYKPEDLKVSQETMPFKTGEKS
jgi:hypothetical protein